MSEDSTTPLMEDQQASLKKLQEYKEIQKKKEKASRVYSEDDYGKLGWFLTKNKV